MKIDDSNREYSESEVRSYIKGLNARIVNAEGTIDELKKTTEFLRNTLGKSNDKVIKLKAERDEMESENERLKSMLKTALSTINHLCFCGSENCELCVYDNNIDECDNSEGFEWVYEEQALKLIGEEK